jgi:hypothetical protein
LESISSGAVGTRSPSQFVQPMAMTLVMGDLNAVVAAQEAHLGLLDSGGIGANAGDIGRNRFFLGDAGLIIFAGVVPWRRRFFSVSILTISVLSHWSLRPRWEMPLVGAQNWWRKRMPSMPQKSGPGRWRRTPMTPPMARCGDTLWKAIAGWYLSAVRLECSYPCLR